jgi:Uma2 family endonuclease
LEGALATDAKPKNQTGKPYRLTVQQYLAMIVSGIIPHDAHVELLDGRIVDQMTKFAPHNYTARQLGLILKSLLRDPWLISEEKSVILGRNWRPEPDLTVIRGPNSRYRKVDPNAKDIGIIIEVADSSYAVDRGEKWRAYAAARIPVYWIVNLNKGQIEVYTEPVGRAKNASYRELATFGIEEEVPVIIDGHEVGKITVKDILP